MKKIYISGQITGIEEQATKLFKDAELDLVLLGYEVVNPMELNHDHDKTWQNYMKHDIKAMMDCDEIYMLNNWIKSKGAIIEHNLAVNLGFNVMYQEFLSDPSQSIKTT